MKHTNFPFRIGVGYDVHRLVAGRPLVLGGVRVPSPVGLAGHSDADVLLHALMDAMLGAAGLGDIGRLFPDTDPRFKDASSATLAEQVVERLRTLGWQVANADATVAAEQPKLAPYIPGMVEQISRIVGTDAVNVKATTAEGLGFVGAGHGMAAYAVVLLARRDGED